MPTVYKFWPSNHILSVKLDHANFGAESSWRSKQQRVPTYGFSAFPLTQTTCY